jgi:hypothetical protein
VSKKIQHEVRPEGLREAFPEDEGGTIPHYSTLNLAIDFYERGQYYKAKALIQYCLNIGLIDDEYIEKYFPDILD